MFLHLTVVDVSSQSCTITPTSPDGLDRAGGAVVDGTANVTIECRCVDNDGNLLNRMRWYYPGNQRIGRNPPAGDPFIILNTNKRPTILVIPTFSDSTSGVYTCGSGNNNPTVVVTINLTIGDGKC